LDMISISSLSSSITTPLFFFQILLARAGTAAVGLVILMGGRTMIELP
jgi:hypothetical protein